MKWLDGMPCAKKYCGATEDKGSMKECLKEVSVSAKLNHLHIVKLLCMSEQPEVSFLMELMHMSLSDFIKERWNHHLGIEPDAAINMMLQIARGMEYLHKQGIVHRDLKPSNILVIPSEVAQMRDLGYAVVKLTDFGLAKMKVLDLIVPTRKMGTPRWMAPEVHVADKLPIDWKKADAYSFAITCSRILTGMELFSDGFPSKLYARIMKYERPKLPSSCPREVISPLEDCWGTGPSVRPSFTKIREALTIVKEGLLELEWSGLDEVNRKSKKLEGSKSVGKPWCCGSDCLWGLEHSQQQLMYSYNYTGKTSGNAGT